MKLRKKWASQTTLLFVRLLNENSEVRMNQAKTTAEIIKKQIDEKGMIDVGAGVERELGISRRN
ncbi:MAG: hypothetical protein ACLT76_09240 [Clostridium fessum]